MFLKSLISFAVRNSDRYERSKFEPAVQVIDRELEGIQKEKEFVMSEGKIREAIRKALREQYGVGKEKEEEGGRGEAAEVGRPFRPHGTEQDAKLER